MNFNNQAMPMGDNTGQAGDGQTGPRRHFKHVGELVDGGAKVVIMYRTVPDEPNNCLVVGTKFLPDLYHNSLMKAVESDGGNIRFMSYEAGVVSVLLQGACSGCPSSTVTLKQGIENLLKKMLPTLVKEVVAVNG